ncbi:MAG: hypothetical protein OXI18_04990 [bacterium]|nr:hypothetical protein [bacterium]
MPFSTREHLREEGPLIFDDAPEGVRYGIREVLHEIGFETPSQQRTVLCKALRVQPHPSNFSDYPNIENEVSELTMHGPWYKFFDALERIPTFLKYYDIEAYYRKVNDLLADENVGYRFEGSKIVRVGTEDFESAISDARAALSGDRFSEARRQFERGLELRNARPADWANAIKEAVNSVEAILQIIYNRPGESLTGIVSADFPENVPSNIKILFKSLYGQGSGTVGARHASIGGNNPSGPRAELAIHVAAALHAFALSELDSA